jgi:hypoxanthine phosphoribosyltransferase
MRAGLFFANGIADQIEDLGYPTSLILLDDNKISDDDLAFIQGKEILIVDAVINTGKTLFKYMEQLSDNDSLKVATTVIPNNSLQLFDKTNLYTIRISENQYKGAKVKYISNGKGPDTGDRLYNTM